MQTKLDNPIQSTKLLTIQSYSLDNNGLQVEYVFHGRHGVIDFHPDNAAEMLQRTGYLKSWRGTRKNVQVTLPETQLMVTRAGALITHHIGMIKLSWKQFSDIYEINHLIASELALYHEQLNSLCS